MATQPVLLSNLSELGDGLGPRANIINGAQLGVGILPSMLDVATPLVFPPVQIVVLKTPTMYRNTPNMSKLIKSLMESHAKSVSGIDLSYTVDTVESPIGHDGQSFASPTTVKRAPVDPSFTFDELTGNIVWYTFYRWICDMQDPDTNFAQSGRTTNLEGWVSSAYSAAFMALQFDQTGRSDRMIAAAYYSNVFPKNTGELGMERQIGQSNQRERSISFSAHLLHNRATLEIGKEIAAKLSLHATNVAFPAVDMSGMRPATTDVESGLELSGIQDELDQIAANS